MAEVKWIKITTDIFNDEKILLIEQMPDADSLLVIWFKLLCMAGKENNFGVFVMRNRMPYTEEMLATIFRRPINTVRLALSTFEAFGMIDIEDDIISIPNWEKHQNIEGMERIREQTRNRVAKHREKQKLLQAEVEKKECNVTERYSNATDKIRIDKNREDKRRKDKNSNKELALQLLDSLLVDFSISEPLVEKLREWLTYKAEKKQTYKETGLKTLLKQVAAKEQEYGSMAVMDLIDDCMARNYSGIIWDRLKNTGGQKTDFVDMWRNV